MSAPVPIRPVLMRQLSYTCPRSPPTKANASLIDTESPLSTIEEESSKSLPDRLQLSEGTFGPGLFWHTWNNDCFDTEGYGAIDNDKINEELLFEFSLDTEDTPRELSQKSRDP